MRIGFGQRRFPAFGARVAMAGAPVVGARPSMRQERATATGSPRAPHATLDGAGTMSAR
jgi:hypothetical protein